MLVIYFYALGQFRHELPPSQETVVLRAGKKYTIPVSLVVLGDIVDVKLGDRAPADIRIIRSAGLKVNFVL
jgi:magnesium-transporting ATPase (P-type)